MQHDESPGRTSRKNKGKAEQIKQEIEDIKELLGFFNKEDLEVELED